MILAPTASSRADLHRLLAHANAERLRPRGPDSPLPEMAQTLAWEARFLAKERAAVAGLVRDVPGTAEAFVAWFRTLEASGPGQGDPLFPWLADHASLADMRWFLAQEAAGEAGFDDLVALAQVKLPARPKLELARNYWDEMGHGRADGMHGRMLDDLVQDLGLTVAIDSTIWPALALGNLMVGLATRRDYAYHALGALGVVELTAPGRVAQVAAGLRRLGIGAAARRYFEVHAVLDRKHSAAWNAEVLAPLVAADPRTARWIAEGALMRLTAGARCFAGYRWTLASEAVPR